MPNDKDFELDDLDSFSFDELTLENEDELTLEPQEGEDKFGVWVKGTPEDLESQEPDSLELSSGDESVLEISEAPEVGTPSASMDDGLPEEDFLSSEELAKLDDQFDFVTVSDEPLEGETLDEGDAPDAGLLTDGLELPDLADFDDGSFQGAASPEPESTSEDFMEEEIKPAPASANDDLPADFNEISLDDFVSFDENSDEKSPEIPVPTADDGSPIPGGDDELNEEFLDIDIEIEDEIDDEELEILEGAQVVREEQPEAAPLDGAEEIDLSEFADFEIESTDETTTSSPQNAEEAEESGFDASEFELDAADLTLEGSEAEVPGIEQHEGVFEESVFDDHVDEPVELNLEPQDEMDMDHIIALEEDLTSGIRQTPSEQAEPIQQASATKDAAAEILSKIERELSSIKQEITELKKEVTHLRSPSEGGVTVEAKEDEKKPHGFFDEEDDETIALTGDELDNILSTAEINEEEEAGETLDDDLSMPTEPVAQDILLTDTEGNIVEPEEQGPVSDEEFLSGTQLELEPEDELILPETDDMAVQGPFEDDILAEEAETRGVPSSIELEETLPDAADEDATEDLLAGELNAVDELDLAPLPPGVMEAESPVLDIPFDEEISLDDEALSHVPEEKPEPYIHTTNEAEELWSGEIEEFSTDQVLEDTEIAEDTSPGRFDDDTSRQAETLTPPNLAAATEALAGKGGLGVLSPNLKDELKSVLSYMDRLLASLPDEKIQEFAESEHFEVYKRLFEELGLIE